MELTTQPTQFENAIDLLEINMKKKNKILPANLRKEFIKLLKQHTSLVTLKGNRFIISVQFYPVWIKKFKLDLSETYVDASHYKFFRKLSKYGYTHPKSSYFPKKLALITLNPNSSSIYKSDVQDMSKYTKEKKSFYNRRYVK